MKSKSFKHGTSLDSEFLSCDKNTVELVENEIYKTAISVKRQL